MKSPYRKEGRISRLFHWTEEHEFLSILILAALAVAVVYGGINLFRRHAAYRASETAKTYVGRRTFVGAKWFMFQGRVELYEGGQQEGEGLSVPANTDFGCRLSNEFIKSWREGRYYVPDLKLPLTVNMTYEPGPQNKWPESFNTRDYEEGAYLHFEVLDEGGGDVAGMSGARPSSLPAAVDTRFKPVCRSRSPSGGPLRTTRMPPDSLARLPGGPDKSCGLEHLLLQLVPGDAFAGVLLVGFEPAVEFLPLGVCQCERFGHGGDAVPDVFDELDALGNAQFEDVGK